MATKLEGGGGGMALVAGPLKKKYFFAASPTEPALSFIGIGLHAMIHH